MDKERVLQLVEQNDEEARRALFEEYYRRTYAVVFSILRNRESSEDITQDAFIKSFQNMHQLREKDKFGPWLAVIASNLARNFLKREKRVLYTDDMTLLESDQNRPGSNTEEQVLRDWEADRVRQALQTLPPDQYQVVVLQYYYDLKLEEIAEMLKISAGTVKSRLFRAKKKLSRLLESMEPNAGKDTHSYKGGGA